jgi:hypothetical protein
MPSRDNTPSSPFGRGWIPAGRELGLPDDGAAALACAGSPAPLASSGALREPECRADPRHNAFTPDRQARFLHVLATCGSVRAAAGAVGVSATAVYLCRRRVAAFAAGWDAALVLARDHAEQVLAERAMEGVDEPVFYRGEEIGFRRRFDSRLLLAHLARLDRRCAEGGLAVSRAGRFDELLLRLAEGAAGEGAAADDLPPVRPGADPFLPPTRRDHVERATDGLGPRAYPRARRAAEAEWDARQAGAQARIDALLGDPPGAPGGATAAAESWPAGAEFKSLDSVNRVNLRAGAGCFFRPRVVKAGLPEKVKETGGRIGAKPRNFGPFWTNMAAFLSVYGAIRL